MTKKIPQKYKKSTIFGNLLFHAPRGVPKRVLLGVGAWSPYVFFAAGWFLDTFGGDPLV